MAMNAKSYLPVALAATLLAIIFGGDVTIPDLSEFSPLQLVGGGALLLIVLSGAKGALKDQPYLSKLVFYLLIGGAALIFAASSWVGEQPVQSLLNNTRDEIANRIEGRSAFDLIPNISDDDTQRPLTAEEQAARLEREQQEGELAATQAANAAAAREAERIAAERVREASLQEAEVLGPCLTRYKDETDCQRVRFGVEEKYERTPTTLGNCIVADPGAAVRSIPLGGGQMRYLGIRPGALVLFFETEPGRFGC